MPIPQKLKHEIERFAEEYLLKHPVSKVKADKVIHDTLWGTQLLKKHEIAMLDSPLIQRLRQIRQAGFVYLTYPTTTHSRFEHTLGVICQGSRLAQALHTKYPEIINDETITNIRVAALLHDCGHGPFSHTSEEIYGYSPEMERLTKVGGTFEAHNPHEVLAYLILQSDPFREYLKNIQREYDVGIDLDFVSNAIIKKTTGGEKCKVEILNGPFDADKLDYIYRDSHFSGIKLTVDLDRLWYTAEIDVVPELDARCLTIRHNGALTLEQILFCKMSLFATIYHHPKVRACDCMFKGIIEYCINRDIKLAGRDLSKLITYLYLTDEKLSQEANSTKNGELHQLIHNLLYRRLFKRALVISQQTIIDPQENSLKIHRLSTPSKDNRDKLRDIAKAIWEEAGKPCLLEEVWIDLPKKPHFKETYSTYIKRQDDSFIQLNENFPIDPWVEQYSKNKWKGHVFCPPDDEIREKIHKAARNVFKDLFSIEFNNYSNISSRVPQTT
ncbi:MAG: HD domain-containing protein [Syntrophorhabdaceae bacterium]